MARRPALTEREVSQLRPELREAIRLCERWAGLRVGDPVPCRSPLIGRTLELKPSRREPRGLVEVVGCAVPKSDRPSKRCKVAYLVKPLKGQGMLPFTHAVDGGKVKNASRTPRPTHDIAVAAESDDPHRWKFLGDMQRLNVEEGLPAMTGLDLPYRHRVGSSVCCPDHPWSVPVLSESLRWAMEGHGIGETLAAALLGLGRHLRDRHGVKLHVPRALAPEDEAAAAAILAASDGYCATVLTEWEARQAEEERERRSRKRKRKRSSTSADKAKRKRAVQRASRHTRAELMRALGAGFVPGEPVYFVETADGETNVGVTSANEFRTRAEAQAALEAYRKRTGDQRRLVVRSAPYEKPRKLSGWERLWLGL